VSDGAAPKIRSFANAAAVSDALARTVIDLAREHIASRGRFTVALSGGETPRAAYRLLGSHYRNAIDWPKLHVFFTDERFVPPEDARNNASMTVQEWLARVSIPLNQVHAIPTIGGTAAECADRYEGTLRTSLTGNETFDLAIMGIGTDGHTASLFPGADSLSERHRWVLAVQAPPGVEPRDRITLTLPVLRGAARIVFAAVGKAKRERVAETLAGHALLPAALVRGRESTEWLLDDEARPSPFTS
jgi:6-phosphogluconolactonase